MSKMIEVLSKLKNSPKINVRYGLKDKKSAEIELFSDAYKNAKTQAHIIAQAAGLKVVKCAKTSINENDGVYYSKTSYDGAKYCKASSNVSEIMAQTYTPEDIVVEQEIYCVFIAE